MILVDAVGPVRRFAGSGVTLPELGSTLDADTEFFVEVSRTDQLSTPVAGVFDGRPVAYLAESGDAHIRLLNGQPFQPAGEKLTVMPSEAPGVQHDGLVSGLAAVLGAITVVMTALGLVYNPAILFVALTFGASTYFVYYHASGRLAARLYRRVERQAAQNAADDGRRRRRGGFGAGPREEWRPPRNGATARESVSSGRERRQRGTRDARQRTRPTTTGPSETQAYRTLGLDPGADETTVKRAYREMVKEVHPDTEGGDEQAFKEVTAAYERLTD